MALKVSDPRVELLHESRNYCITEERTNGGVAWQIEIGAVYKLFFAEIQELRSLHSKIWGRSLAIYLQGRHIRDAVYVGRAPQRGELLLNQV